MARFTVRTLCSEDFVALRQLEADVFGAAGDDVLCPHYLRLCTSSTATRASWPWSTAVRSDTCCALFAIAMPTVRRWRFARSFSARA